MIPRFQFSYTIHDFIDETIRAEKGYGAGLDEFQNYFNGSQPIFVGKARIGIRMALQALGLKSGSAVGVQPFTCSSVLSAIKRAGFRIVFIDMDRNLRMSLVDLKNKNNSIDALIVTHIFGFPDDVESCRIIMGDKPIIEDCAQAFLSAYKGKPVGMSAEAGIFSTGYGKLFGIGYGGFVVSGDNRISTSLLKQAGQLQFPSKAAIARQSFRNLGLGILYHPLVYSLFTYTVKKRFGISNARLQEYPIRETSMASSGISRIALNFTKNQQRVQRQRANGILLKGLVDQRYNPIEPLIGSEPNYFVFLLQSENRDLIVNYLATKGIEAGKFFSNSIYWVQEFGYHTGDCPGFERIASTLFTLPCHDYLSEKQVNYIAETLNKFHVA